MKPSCIIATEGRDALHLWDFGNMPILALCASAYPSVLLSCVQKNGHAWCLLYET